MEEDLNDLNVEYILEQEEKDSQNDKLSLKETYFKLCLETKKEKMEEFEKLFKKLDSSVGSTILKNKKLRLIHLLSNQNINSNLKIAGKKFRIT